MKQVKDVKERMKTEKYAEERPTIFSTSLSEEDIPDGYWIPSMMDLKDEATLSSQLPQIRLVMQ